MLYSNGTFFNQLQPASFLLKQSKELAEPPDAQNTSTVQISLDMIRLDVYTCLVIMEDPVAMNEKSQAKSANKRTHLTESELQELLEVARKTDVRAWAMFA